MKMYMQNLEGINLVHDKNDFHNIKLLPYMTTETACRIILAALLHTIILNENGIKNGIDPNFLHDFRVAIRRTRSLLSQVKKVFPKHLVKPFRTGFKYFAKSTNTPRDIDVFLLRIDNFIRLMPGKLKEGLIPLHNHLKEQQDILYEKLSRELESIQYKTLIKEWSRFLNTTLLLENKPSKADIPVLKTAIRVIRKQYLNVLESGLLIQENSPPLALHSLRIECKKLKYLLEFFLSLFPEEIIKTIISRMKSLQDNLGVFQDLQVQKEILSHFLEQTGDGAEKEAEQGLSDHLKIEEEKVRGKFQRIFDQFNSEEIRSCFLVICREDAGFPEQEEEERRMT